MGRGLRGLCAHLGQVHKLALACGLCLQGSQLGDELTAPCLLLPGLLCSALQQLLALLPHLLDLGVKRATEGVGRTAVGRRSAGVPAQPRPSSRAPWPSLTWCTWPHLTCLPSALQELHLRHLDVPVPLHHLLHQLLHGPLLLEASLCTLLCQLSHLLGQPAAMVRASAMRGSWSTPVPPVLP